MASESTLSPKVLWAGRILSALPCLLLAFSGTMKLAGPPAVLEGFVKLGYGAHMAKPIGAVELLCTALYLFPRTSVLGAILLTGYMGGATATHVRVGEPFLPAILVGVLLWGGLYLRDPRLRALLPLRQS